MGKKKHDVMAQERARFVEGALANGVDKKQAGEVFDTMEKFASYGFNKSHAAAYSVLAFRTGYLKAHYPAEYMAAVLTHNVSDITKITFFMEECRRMGINVLSPCVNESQQLFAVTPRGDIRFGLEAIKGVGGAVIENVIKERTLNGPYQSLFELTKRVPSGNLNRKTMECLAHAGALDVFGHKRSQYFEVIDHTSNILDKAVQYGNKLQAEKLSGQGSLFGAVSGGAGIALPEPKIPLAEDWTLMDKLNREKEVIGFYLSGHPLDTYKLEIKSFTTCGLADLERFQNGKEIRIAGIVTKMREGMTKRGNRYATFSIEDFSGATELALFGEDYAKFRNYIEVNNMLFIGAKYQARFGDTDQLELKVHDVKFLAEAFDKLAKRLLVDIPLDRVDLAFIDGLYDLFSGHKGKVSIDFNVVDTINQLRLPMSSRNVAIQTSAELIRQLETLDLEFSLK